MANVPFERQHASAYLTDLIAWFVGLSLDTAGRITDLNDGGNLKTFLETIALRFEHLDSKVFLSLERAIPTVLYEFFGEGDGATTTVGFPRLPALRASGRIRFHRALGAVGDLEIPVGARAKVPGTGNVSDKNYETIEPVVMPEGEDYAEALAQSTEAGTRGNTPALTMRLRDLGPADPQNAPTTSIDAATNPAAWLNGAGEETDEGRRQRFVVYLRNLARAQYAGLERGALTATILTAGEVTERVLFARALPVTGKRGLVSLTIDNGGAGASPALVAAAQRIVDGGIASDGSRLVGYKAAGIVVAVQAVTEQVVNIDVRITPDPGLTLTDVRAAVVTAIETYVFGLGVFADLILADLICRVVSVRGVADVAIVTPTANVTTAAGARILPGTITVTAA